MNLEACNEEKNQLLPDALRSKRKQRRKRKVTNMKNMPHVCIIVKVSMKTKMRELSRWFTKQSFLFIVRLLQSGLSKAAPTHVRACSVSSQDR